MADFELHKFKTAEELARTAASEWVRSLAAEGARNQSYSVALSGGRITTPFLSAVADGVKQGQNTIGAVHFFWADERCVPPDHPENNFRLARQALFLPLRIPERQIHRIRGEEPPEKAAAEAAVELLRVAPASQSGQPVLDLVFLGLGENGHVASLFPGEPEEVIASPAVYRPVFNSPKPPPERITLGYPAIAAARQVWVLVSGRGKETALRESLAEGGSTPLGRVIRSRSRTRIFTDV